MTAIDGASAHPIPGRLNLAILAAASLASLGALAVAVRAEAWWVTALAALAFSFTNNTIFSLHHEAVHGILHPDRRLNEAAGVVCAAFFPTIFAVQRVSHLGHHNRNRTDEELYDCHLPHQSRWLKTYWIYCLLTGFYWAIIPVAMSFYMLCPWLFRARGFQDGPARWWGFRPFVRDIAALPIRRVWPQGLATVAIQTAIVTGLGLDVTTWIVCWWAFGLNWSSVQYTDHAGAPRDVIEGAWNLRFTPLSQALFLNYNLHLAHHRRPDVPWLHLPGEVRPEDPRPGFWPLWARLWLGSRPAPPGPGPHPLDRPLTPFADAD
ncbi:MAG: fatty acid desaturase [Phyllobacteriaceae bacterium]|nr:fatty acid desaturase [Phyllobacteriaceae bacterium]